MTKIKQLWMKSSSDERIVLGLVASIFLSLPVCIFALVITLVYLFTQQRFSSLISKNQKSMLLIVFAGLSVGMALLNKNLLGVLVGMAMCLLFLVGMFIQSVMTHRLLKKTIVIACFGSILACLIAVIQSFVFLNTDQLRFSSVFLNPNYYATIIEFVVLLCVYALLQNPSKKYKLFYYATIAINVIGLYLCGCRSAFFALGLATAFMLLLNKKYKPLLLFIGIAALVLLGTFLFPEVFRFGNISKDLTTRTSIWKLAIRDIKKSPLIGHGSMAYMHISGPTLAYAPHGHNLLLDSLLNYGIVGLCLLGVYVYLTVKPLLGTHKTASDNTILYLLCSVFLAILVHGMTDVTILWPQTGLLFLMIWGYTGIYVEETVYHPALEKNTCLLKATSVIVKRY